MQSHLTGGEAATQAHGNTIRFDFAQLLWLQHGQRDDADLISPDEECRSVQPCGNIVVRGQCGILQLLNPMALQFKYIPYIWYIEGAEIVKFFRRI
jgi:hypothetical protein